MKNAAIFLANGFEESEAVIIIDVLRRADIKIDIISSDNQDTVIGAHNIAIKADYHFDEQDHQNYDILILPGGALGVANLIDNLELMQLITIYHQQKKLIAAICAAPQILGKLGLTRNRNISVYPNCFDNLNDAKLSKQAVSIDDNIITGTSMGTAIEFALTIVKILISNQKSEEIAKQLVII